MCKWLSSNIQYLIEKDANIEATSKYKKILFIMLHIMILERLSNTYFSKEQTNMSETAQEEHHMILLILMKSKKSSNEEKHITQKN